MINKRSLWFLTLFCLILVLSIYYVTMPNEVLLPKEEIPETEPIVVIEESNILLALRSEEDENISLEIAKYESVLNQKEASTEEKNQALDKIKDLNLKRSKEEQIEKQIESTYQLESFVKVDKDEVQVVIAKKEHDVKLASEIMNLVQKNYSDRMYISVKFQS